MASVHKKQLETLRTNVWKQGEVIEKLTRENELMKEQITILEAIEGKTDGVEAVGIDPSRIIERRGSKSKKLALAQLINKQNNVNHHPAKSRKDSQKH